MEYFSQNFEKEPDVRFLREEDVSEFRALIKNKKSETEIDMFLRKKYDIFVGILDIFNTGHHYCKAISQPKIKLSISGISTGYILDWILLGKNSDGNQYFFVELKGAEKKIFTKTKEKIYFSQECNKGINQLLFYLDYANRNQAYFRDELKLDNFSNPKGILIIGTADELTSEMKQHKKAWNDILSGKISIITWDRVLRSVENKWNFIKPKQ